MKCIIKNGGKYHIGFLINPESEGLYRVAYLDKGASIDFEPRIKLVEVREYIDIDELKIIKKIITDEYKSKVSELKSTIKSTKRSDYGKEIQDTYDYIKQRIINTATNMIYDLEFNDESFENRLKAICQMKKQIFSIECDGANEARKHNGTVKYNVNKLTRDYEFQMKYLDENLFNQTLNGK